MSWYVSAIGKPAAVAAQIVKQAEGQKCSEPEQTIKRSTIAAVHGALMAFPPDFPVRVEASGSQDGRTDDEKAPNTLSVKIEPIYGWVE